MKILFIDPPLYRFMGFYRFYYPLGLATMASVLHQQGHHVEIFDAEHSPHTDSLSWGQASKLCDLYGDALKDDAHPVWHEIVNYVQGFKPAVVGISVLSVKVASAFKIARLCKEIDPDVIIIVGADHPTIFPSIVLENPDIDFVVRGEGERTVSELIEAMESPQFDDNLRDVLGISYRQNGSVRHNPDRPLISNLDEIPFPRLDSLVQLKSFRPVDFGAVMTSRGCPYHCTFCGVHNVWSRNVRFRSIQNVLDEIAWLKSQYHVDYFSFRDASFTLDMNRTIRFCDELIGRELNITWECLTRADLLTADLLQTMKTAGCVTIRVGIESGDETILKSIKKYLDLEKTKNTADLLNRMGFYWSAYFMFGVPQETHDSIQRTLDYIKVINPPFITLSRFAPIPGSELYADLEKRGMTSNINWSLENNQRLESRYLLHMNSSEFEEEMKRVIDWVDDHNQRRIRELGLKDARLL